AVGFSAMAALVLPHLDAGQSRRGLAGRVLQGAGGAPLAGFRHQDEGVLFYLRRNLAEVAPRGEDARDIAGVPKDERRAAERKVLADRLAVFMNSEEPRFCVIRSEDLESLADKALYPAVLTVDLHDVKSFTLVRNQPKGAGSR